MGPWGTDSEMEISTHGFYQGKLLGTVPVGGREIKQNWAEGDVSCNEVPVQALRDPVGSSGAGIVFPNCPELGQGAWLSYLYVDQSLNCMWAAHGRRCDL